jgi:TonB family protein
LERVHIRTRDKGRQAATAGLMGVLLSVGLFAQSSSVQQVHPPAILKRVEPEYTQQARAAGLQGQVVLTLVVDEQGMPRNIRVIKSLGMGLDECAVNALKMWRFRPATKDSVPVVSAEVTVELAFRLLGQPLDPPVYVRPDQPSGPAVPAPAPQPAPSTLRDPAVTQGTRTQPRVFLQSASQGDQWTSLRDQSMEMSKDFEKSCPYVHVTINQQMADYTVLLNHIEVGFSRNNQLQIADRNGDLISRTIEGGSISGGVKKACHLILADWAKK